jgi:hypothetical protein
MRIKEQYVWQIIFIAFFALLVVLGAIVLEAKAHRPLLEITLFDFTLIALASWRLIRLVVHDVVMQWFREQFYDAVKVGEEYALKKPDSGPRRTLNELLLCPWCFGVWATALVTFFYFITPYAVYPVALLALSAVATLLHLLASLIGSLAERFRRDNERHG